jgi:hypothetical protein
MHINSLSEATLLLLDSAALAGRITVWSGHMSEMPQPVRQASLKNRLARILPLVFVCSLCSGCLVVPMRAPTKTRTAEGKELKRTVDLSFLQAGKTTREEVESKLAWIVTGVRDDRFNLARWAESNWGVVWAAGGYSAGAGGWNRYWKIHNLVIDFDERGIVQQITQIPNEELFQVLMERVRRDPGHPLDLSVAIEVPVEYMRGGQTFPGKLVLGKDSFAFVREQDAKKKNKNKKTQPFEFQAAPDNIRSLLTVNHGKTESNQPQFWAVRIEFKYAIAVGKRMDVKIDLPATLTLIRFVAQMQSGS